MADNSLVKFLGYMSAGIGGGLTGEDYLGKIQAQEEKDKKSKMLQDYISSEGIDLEDESNKELKLLASDPNAELTDLIEFRTKQNPEEKKWDDLTKSAISKGIDVSSIDQGDYSSLAKAIKQSESEFDKKDMLDIASGLRKEFNAGKAFKDYQTISRSERAMRQALEISTKEGGSRIASDQALGVLFQKMLDPDSVVRESEYARTDQGAAALNRIMAIAPQLQRGGLRLSNSDRQALVDVAQKLLQEGKKTYNEHYDRYENIAKEYEVKPKLLFGGLKRFDIDGEEMNSNNLTVDQQKELDAINAAIKAKEKSVNITVEPF